MRVWIATGALVLAAVAAGFALVLQSLLLAAVATGLAVLGLALESSRSGWGEDDSSGQHPFSRHGRNAHTGSRS